MALGKGHRLNGVVRALEEAPAAFTTFSSPGIENAVNLSFTKYDGVVYELEHNPYDIKDLQLSMQFMLHRQQIHDAPTVAPAVAPMVRIPPNFPSGGKLRIRDKGKVHDEKRGDLILSIHVDPKASPTKK